MRLGILGFVAGAAALQTRAVLPEHPAWSLLAVVLITALAIAVISASRQWQRAVVSLPCGLLTGFFWAALLAQSALAPQLAQADEGRDITVVGIVASLPYRFEQGVRFNFAVEMVAGDPAAGDSAAGDPAITRLDRQPSARLPPLISLSWYAGARRADGTVVAVGDVRPGERWSLTVRLQRPHGNANPHGFDYEVWLLEQGLRATGYVRDDARLADKNRRLSPFVFGFSHLVERGRATLRERILHTLAGRKYAGVIVALVVGDQRAIDQSDWLVFNRTGISHLISISGLHITMIAGLFAWLAASLWRRSFFTGLQLPLRLPAQKVAAITGAAVALMYVLLAGFGVPAQRTLYMLIVVAVALWTGRIGSVSHVLCAALGLVVLLDPWAVLWPGFWLSFGAVAIILYATVGRTTAGRNGDAAQSRSRRLWTSVLAGAHTQYVVTLGLVPLTMLLFSQVSLVSPVANAVAIPLISLVVTPLALMGSLLPAPLDGPVLVLAHALVELLAYVLRRLGEQRFAVWGAPLPSWWQFVWALCGTLWLLAPRGWPHRWAGIAAWLPLLAALPAQARQGEVVVTFFDVGQGMAVLVETAGHRLLYDTGPAYAPDSDGGNRVIVPYLKARGIDTLDGLVVTHSDSDHTGGALTVLHAVRVGWLASSLKRTHAIVRAAPRHLRCEAGQHWWWDGVLFEMLQPPAASYRDTTLKPNALSCTLKISAGGHSVLLAGDIEAAQEAQLLARPASVAALKADVLLAPHHGSGTSSTPDFLRAVAPELAIFQVGYRNRYHHPKQQVLDRYQQMGIAALRTDAAGAVTLRLGAAIEIQPYRETHARYWYGR
jgi:competence protein ComEC